MGLSRPSFGFIFSPYKYIVKLQLTNFTMVSDDGKQVENGPMIRHRQSE